MEVLDFTTEERDCVLALSKELVRKFGAENVDVLARLRRIMRQAALDGYCRRDRFGINPLVRCLSMINTLCDEISPDINMAAAIMLFNPCRRGFMTIEQLKKEWGEDVARMVQGLIKVSMLYARSTSVHSDNFRNMLLTFADDIRVIIIMIIDRLTLLRAINHHPNRDAVAEVASEANYLYAPLAHRLGLYVIKSQIEDMSLKYTNRDMYQRIADKLSQSKLEREKYIADFIAPLKAKLEAAGLKFDIKGRTKSIYSIWNKMKKQKIDVDGIYDLFAIRIIIDTPPEKEKADCWLAYSIVGDMYRPNPARMKDWITIPKSNGYESLHTTVYGPGERWVEVQIRTRRMDLVAEKGLAAHWRYKGIKSEGNLDAWMNNVRDILETSDAGPLEQMRNMHMDVYEKEVFVFTPKGDLYSLPLGATLIDFAFMIHTNLGTHCTGGRVNGKNRKINYKLVSGDTIEIMSSPTQQPKLDWLNFTITNKARNKIRVALKENESHAGDLGKELLQRRFKNRKLDFDDGIISKLSSKLGYKTLTEFYSAITDERLETNDVIEAYLDFERRAATTESIRVSADTYVMQQPTAEASETNGSSDSILEIGEGIKGVNYRLARCCNPIYGDEVFGFVSSMGVIKIHRKDCPNAKNIKERYPDRQIKTRWSGNIGQLLGATLHIVGIDDIGIVTNITSIINKEKGTQLRNISIESHDGLFHGYVVVGVSTQDSLKQLIKKLETVKGVKNVQRN